jgi:cathepsin B
LVALLPLFTYLELKSFKRLNLSARMKLVYAICLGVASAMSQERAAMIEQHENTPGVLWKAGPVERFTPHPFGAGLKPYMGVTPEAMLARSEFAKNYKPTLKTMDIPDSFDSETNWPKCAKVIGDIRDQSACGCCWAFAAASAASDRLCIATNASIMVPLSAQDVCFCASSNGCMGGDIHTPWNHMKLGGFFGSGGVVTGGQYQGTGPFGPGLCADFSLPHCHHHGPQGKDPYPPEKTKGCPNVDDSPKCPKKCDSTAAAPHNDFKADQLGFKGEVISASGEQDIQQAIMAGGPVETAFTVYSDFENYVSGIYHHVSGSMARGHAVRIVGWGSENGPKYWKIANSWNPYWGEKGYFRIVRGKNEGGIEDEVTGSSPTAKWGHKSDLLEELAELLI